MLTNKYTIRQGTFIGKITEFPSKEYFKELNRISEEADKNSIIGSIERNRRKRGRRVERTSIDS